MKSRFARQAGRVRTGEDAPARGRVFDRRASIAGFRRRRRGASSLASPGSDALRRGFALRVEGASLDWLRPGGTSSVGRAQASQAWGREFESRVPLQEETLNRESRGEGRRGAGAPAGTETPGRGGRRALTDRCGRFAGSACTSAKSGAELRATGVPEGDRTTGASSGRGVGLPRSQLRKPEENSGHDGRPSAVPARSKAANATTDPRAGCLRVPLVSRG